MEKVGIFYGSSTGNTKDAAEKMQQYLTKENADLYDVANASADDIEKYSNLIFGSSTWGDGELQDDFYDFISVIKKAELSNQKIAIFGFGDQETYPDTFVDAIGEIYEALKMKACELIGMIPAKGYDFIQSLAEVDGHFVGLPLDDENQSNLTEERIEQWIKELSSKFH